MKKSYTYCSFRNNVVLLPMIMKDQLVQLTPAESEGLELPVAEALHAGFPSPAADYSGDRIDIVEELIRHKETTFFARIDGDSMCDAGIHSGDLVVIDRSLMPKDGDFVAACVDGEFTLKEYRIEESTGTILLLPHNDRFSVIRITDPESLIIWGVITYCIHKTCR